MSKVEIQQDTSNPVPPIILAEALISISASFRKLTKSGLNRRAIIALLHDDTGLRKKDLVLVLDSLDDLAKNFTVVNSR